LFSVYFTDVVPFLSLLKEATRVLKPNGLFVHFGPLLHHPWVVDKFTGSEILEEFEHRGFETHDSGVVSNTSLASANSLRASITKNLSFSAIKKPLSQQAMLKRSARVQDAPPSPVVELIKSLPESGRVSSIIKALQARSNPQKTEVEWIEFIENLICLRLFDVNQSSS
jgi:hypothetical protein